MVFCKEKVLDDYERLQRMIKRNNKIRMSIDMILLNVSRPLLRKIELAFRPGLSTVTWLSEHLDDYFDNVEQVNRCDFNTKKTHKSNLSFC